MPSDSTITPKSHPRWPALALLAALLALSLPLILCGNMRGRGAGDQVNFHEKTIRALAADWPHFNFQGPSYLTATTPGYHLLLASIARAGLDSTTALRLASCAISAILILALAAFLSRRLPPLQAFAVALPLVFSLYVVQSAAWLLPDNTAWRGVLAVLLLCLAPRQTARTLLAAAFALALLVFIRQIHIWAAAIIWAGAWLGPASAEGGEADQPLLSNLPRRIPRAVLAFAATLPAFAVLAYFFKLWGGLTPPNFQNFYSNLSPAAPAFILSLLGLGSIFFAAWFAQPLLAFARRYPAAIVLTITAAALVAIIPATTYANPGRFSGVWNATKPIPSIAHHTSPLILILSILGAVCLLGWSLVLPRRERWIILAALAGFTAAQAASGQLWQRYTEPFILMLLPIMASLIPPARDASMRTNLLRTAGPLALAAILLVVTLQKLATDDPAIDKGQWDPATNNFAPASISPAP